MRHIRIEPCYTRAPWWTGCRWVVPLGCCVVAIVWAVYIFGVLARWW